MQATEGAPAVPCVFLTGFLGAGKTTLLNRILTAPQPAWRVAVIQNEYVCEFGVENELTARRSTAFQPQSGAEDTTDLSQVLEEVVEFGGQCLCCSASGMLRKTLATLLQRRQARLAADPAAQVFSHVLIEATGRALAGPIAEILSEQPGLRLAAVVCVVDAATAARRLLLDSAAPEGPTAAQELGEAVEQVVHADYVVLNKADLCPGGVEGEHMRRVEAAVRRMNPTCRIVVATRCEAVPLAVILAPAAASCALQRRGAAGATLPRQHDSSIEGASVCLPPELPLLRTPFEDCLRRLLQEHGDRLLRLKGIVSLAGADRRLVVQCVGRQMELCEGRAWDAGELRETVIALIGYGASAVAASLRPALEACGAPR